MAGSIQGQDLNYESLKSWQLIGYAESAERIYDSYTAIDYYSEYYRRNKYNAKVSQKLADLYFDINDFKSAKPIYKKLFETNNKKYSYALFKLGKILKTEYRYDSAVIYFERFRDDYLMYFPEEKQDFYSYLIEFEIQGCEIADDKTLKNSESNIKIRALNSSINKAHKEYAPIIWFDTLLIYSSLNSDTIPKVRVDNFENMPSEKFYSAKLKGDQWIGGFLPPRPFFNFDSLATSDGVLSDDGKRFYFTVKKSNKYGKQIGAIYECRLNNGIWTEPAILDERINLKGYTSINPAIGKCYIEEFDVLYFVSDRNGGVGGLDIWYTIYDKVNDIYKMPHNVGSYLNTPGDEVTPFFDYRTKSLYFSSNGLPGYGGFDIFKSIGEMVNWTPPENIGFPFNSAYNDIHFINNKKDTLGFLVSNRSESKVLKSPHCCFDIFSYNLEKSEQINITGKVCETDSTLINNLIKYNKDKLKNKDKPLNSAGSVIDLHIKNKNDGSYIFISKDTTNNDGEFNFEVEKDQNYMLTIKKDKFRETKIEFNTSELKDRIITFEPITIIPINNNPITIDNIYFEFNKWKLTKSSAEYIDSTVFVVMNKYKNIVVEISAHTDGIGSENYNLELSKKRAENMVEYLLSKGIQRERIIAKGYGEARPLLNEITFEGLDNPGSREKNRRIEFRIVGVVIKDLN